MYICLYKCEMVWSGQQVKHTDECASIMAKLNFDKRKTCYKLQLSIIDGIINWMLQIKIYLWSIDCYIVVFYL